MPIRLRPALYALVTLASILVLVYVYMFLTKQPLPTLNNVQKIQVRFTTREGIYAKFEIAEQHWNELYSSLLPAEYDWKPAKWVAMGSLEITTKDGVSHKVDLYRVTGGKGAFSLGQMNYYRGGDSSELRKTLESAYETSKLIK